MQNLTSFRRILPIILLLAGCASEPIRKTHTPHSESATNSAPQSNIVNKAQAFYQRGDFKNAAATLDSVPGTEISAKERAEYWNLKGLLELNAKHPENATQNFHRAIEENQAQEYRGYYQYNLATALYTVGKHQESYDILNSIDLGSVDQAQQHKVLALKEKDSQAVAAAKKKGLTPTTTSVTTTVTGSSDATREGVSPAVIVSPEVVYTGGVNRKKIGLLVPLSGKYEAFGKKVQRSVELAFQNSSDGRAKEYAIIAVDSGDTAESQTKALQKLVEQEEVIAVIGPLLSKGIETLANKAVYYQVPLISLAQVHSPLASHLFFCSISSRNQVSQVVRYSMENKGYRRFAVIAPSNAPGEELAQTFKNEVLARTGEIAHLEYYDPNITDFRAAVDKVLGLDHPEKRADEMRALAQKRKELKITRKTPRTAQYYNLPPIVDFDAVYIADEAKTAGQIIPTFTYRDAKKLKYLGITSWNSSQLVQRAQEEAEDAIFPVAFNTINASTDTKAFFDLYSATYNAVPGELDAISFDAAALLIKALKNSPSSRDELRTILETTSNVQGATGEFSINDRRCSRELSLVEVKKGKFEIVKQN